MRVVVVDLHVSYKVVVRETALDGSSDNAMLEYALLLCQVLLVAAS